MSMMYCPICGYFASTANEQTHPKLGWCPPNCHNPLRFYTEEERQKIKMLPVTTENLFCGRCNKIFPKDIGWKLCPVCFRQPLYPITESHLKGNVMLLSGLAAPKIWEND